MLDIDYQFSKLGGVSSDVTSTFVPTEPLMTSSAVDDVMFRRRRHLPSMTSRSVDDSIASRGAPVGELPSTPVDPDGGSKQK